MNEQWESPDNKPEAEKLCLLVTKSEHGGKERLHRVVGMWIERFTEETSEEWGEYSESKDEYYCPEGWYEQQLYNSDDYTSWLISDEVIAWMPLPRYEP